MPQFLVRHDTVRRATRGLVSVPAAGARVAATRASRLAGVLVDDVHGRIERFGDAVGVGRLLRRHGTPEPQFDPPPDGYPDHRRSTLTLTDGLEVRLRPIVPDDAIELRAGLHRLSERTRWLRFHAPITDLPDDQLRHLVTVDHHLREAIVAEVKVDRTCWQPIGVARFDRTEGSAAAEIAIVIEDGYQGRGLGGALLDHLIEAAREEGIEQLNGEVLAENRAVLALLAGRGEAFEVRREGTVLHTTNWLVAPEGEPEEAAVRVSRLKQRVELLRDLADPIGLRDLTLDEDEPGEG